jgi:LPS-assembly lipoprotein
MSWLDAALPSPLAGEGQGGGKQVMRHRSASVRLPILFPLVLTLLFTGCTLRPLYSSGPAGVGPQADLPAIAVDVPVNREEQVYRNALLFALRGGGEGDTPRYDLAYRITIREQEIAVERGTGVPNAYRLTGSASFLLKDSAGGASLFGASVAASDTYARSSQNFSNIRAQRDAIDRLARTLAELTQARLAAYFATN